MIDLFTGSVCDVCDGKVTLPMDNPCKQVDVITCTIQPTPPGQPFYTVHRAKDGEALTVGKLLRLKEINEHFFKGQFALTVKSQPEKWEVERLRKAWEKCIAQNYEISHRVRVEKGVLK